MSFSLLLYKQTDKRVSPNRHFAHPHADTTWSHIALHAPNFLCKLNLRLVARALQSTTKLFSDFFLSQGATKRTKYNKRFSSFFQSS